MNYGVVRYILGRILQAEGCFLVFPIIVGIIYGESDIWAYLITMGICLVVGTLLSIRKPQKGGLFLKGHRPEDFVDVVFREFGLRGHREGDETGSKQKEGFLHIVSVIR